MQILLLEWWEVKSEERIMNIQQGISNDEVKFLGIDHTDNNGLNIKVTRQYE